MISSSIGFRNDALDRIKGILDGIGEIRIYAGAVPATANDGIGTATLLVTIKDGVNGLRFDAAAEAGTLAKDPMQTWAGTNVATGSPTFFRHVLVDDTDAASNTAKRYQGSVSTVGADLNLTQATLQQGAVQTIQHFAIRID